jgi:hypothetical protein
VIAGEEKRIEDSGMDDVERKKRKCVYQKRR